MMDDVFLGRFLDFRTRLLAAEVGATKFDEFLRHYKLKGRGFNLLTDGNREQVSVEVMYRLATLADRHGMTYPKVRESSLWMGFKNRRFEAIAAADSEAHSHTFCGRLGPALSSGFNFSRARPDLTGAEVADLMSRENLVVVGSGLNNAATDWALRTMFGGDPEIYFYHPQANESSKRRTVRRFDGQTKALGIANEPFMREIENEGLVGLVARRTVNTATGTATTVAIAGCSRHSTRKMCDEILDGYRFYDPLWDADDAKPALMLFNSARSPSWQLYGRAARKPGRPKKIKKI